MHRFVCIHGHFYQPPRENPWLESVESQDSARPYHDWNERITDECYAPNGHSRILGEDGRIADVVSNYARMSLDFGPTLLSWMEAQSPHTYRAVLDADADSRRRFGGHGAAIAQAYNHMILPLASARDKRTQVIWGVRDFEHRFGRAPEGMWLPETAVDLDSLEALADQGIRFTILAPHQAARVRRVGGRTWHDVRGGRIDPTRAYRVPLPSGRAISVFFYDGPISRAVAFEGLLNNGERFARRVLDGFDARRTWAQIVSLATDGETYGHHHRHGDMALAFAMRYLETQGLARLTIPGEYLELHPPAHEVAIREGTSWSCAHGVERWRADCGCASGNRPGWSQAWRAPLRQALDHLRDELAARYAAAGVFADPWAARDDYIAVVLDRSPDRVDAFLADHLEDPDPDTPQRIRALELLELQRHAMLMYTSCGWFFDEISGIETVQILRYAARAIQLGRAVFGDDLEPAFLDDLARAPSNLPEFADGAGVYRKLVRPAMVDLPAVAAHHAVRSLFLPERERGRIYCYRIDTQDRRLLESGRIRAIVGRAVVASEITGRSATLTYAFLHLGDHHVNGGVRPFRGEEAYEQLRQGVVEAFGRGDLAEVIRRLDRYFEGTSYTLQLLFRDDRSRILDLVFEAALREAEAAQRRIYEDHAPLMRYVEGIGVSAPSSLRAAATIVLNLDLERALRETRPASARVRALLDEAAALAIPVDEEALAYATGQTVAEAAERVAQDPEAPGPIADLLAVANLAAELPFAVDLWPAQNVYFDLQAGAGPELSARLAALRGPLNIGGRI